MWWEFFVVYLSIKHCMPTLIKTRFSLFCKTCGIYIYGDSNQYYFFLYKFVMYGDLCMGIYGETYRPLNSYKSN